MAHLSGLAHSVGSRSRKGGMELASTLCLRKDHLNAGDDDRTRKMNAFASLDGTCGLRSGCGAVLTSGHSAVKGRASSF